MKRFLCLVMALLMTVTLCACGSEKKTTEEVGEVFDSVSQMQEETSGIWTDEAGRNQIEITYNGAVGDVIFFTFRNSDYEDEYTMATDLRWIYDKGRIEWNDGENVIVVEKGGRAILSNGVRLTKGGSLVARPIPKEILWDAAMTTTVSVSIWDIPFERLYNRVMRDVTAEYTPYEEYDSKELRGVYDDTIDGLGSPAYVVTLSGQVCQNPELDFLYYKTETIATFVIVVKGSQAVYAVCDSVCDHLTGTAALYAASLM